MSAQKSLLLLASGDVGRISGLTGYPQEFCELAVRQWREVSAKIGQERVVDPLPGGGFKIRNMEHMRHLQAVLKKLDG